MSTTQNPYENAARERKALKIAAALRAYDFHSSDVRAFRDEPKLLALRMAGIHSASEATWKRVAEIIDSLEAPKVDPFGEAGRFA